MVNLEKNIAAILPELTRLRRDLHAHPELGYEEKRTAAKVVEFLGAHQGMEITEGVAGTGLVVLLGRDRPGPCVALRADMDALPIEEESDLPWRSTVTGKMHACGHDGHTAMLAGAIRILADHQEELGGPVKFIFQPAEEGGGGGRRMCEEGVLENPRVAAIYGLHNNLPDPHAPMGHIYLVPGAAMAGTGTFDIEVVGLGGHAAFPHRCKDSLYIASSLVQQLQGIVSREIDPKQPAVVSVTRFHAGSAYNIIPGSAQLAGTFRALDMEVLEQLRQSIIDRAQGITATHGVAVKIRCETDYPVLVNHPLAEATFRSILTEVGMEDKLQSAPANLGGEDFAFYAQEVPGLFYFLPAAYDDPSRIHGCHHPSFDFNDALLPLGLRLHLETARRFARHWKP